MKYCIYILLLCFGANVFPAFAQTPVPAFPDIEKVEELLSSESAQFYLKLSPGTTSILKKNTKRVKQWMVNLKEIDDQHIHFLIRTHKLKPLYEGEIRLRQGKWEVDIQTAMPGQFVMLLFVADHLTVNKGRLAILPVAKVQQADRILLGNHLVSEMNAQEEKLDFDRWRLRQLRKYGDIGTHLPALREASQKELTKYLSAVLPAGS